MESDQDCIPHTIEYSFDILNELYKVSKPKTIGLHKYLNDVKFPALEDFQPGLEWFNVSEPLSMHNHLKGKIVVLDFFTYCCINCMHILPDLKELEETFSVEDGLVVVGVHSAKFENEKISNNILSAVQRYNISHPVVNDSACDMWKKCGINCWPTLLVVGPNASPLLMLMGEGNKEELRFFIENTLAYYRNKNQISSHKLPLKSAFHLLPNLKGPLLFPGKISSFIDNGVELYAVSDTGNHRVLIMEPEGVVVKQIGGIRAGFKDGDLENSEFNSPQGLVFQNKDILFVADTENHAIRKIDLSNNTVTTIAGTGDQGSDHTGGNPGNFQEISSPWDVLIFKTHDLNKNEDSTLKEVLLVAMAGTHQIWAIFLHDIVWWKNKSYKAGTCICVAGNGKEENRNNQYPHAASFAQPSGLALAKKSKELYIADSESSTIRKLSLNDGKVSAVVGGDKNPYNLFAFGDKDGTTQNAKLQHPLGLCLSNDESTLLIADTYNHKLKKVDVLTNTATTLCGKKANDTTDAPDILFNEPAGLCVSKDNKILIADTNNHNIKILEFNEDGSVKNIKNLDLTFSLTANKPQLDLKGYDLLTNKPITLNEKGGKLIVKCKLSFEAGITLTKDAPQKWKIILPNSSWASVPLSGSNVENLDVVINVPPININEESINLVFTIVICSADFCIPKKFVIKQGIIAAKNDVLKSEILVNVVINKDQIKLI